jgi:hypothetical protein
VTELELLFRRLVDNLIAIDPARLHRPLQVGELYESVLPYRTNRRSLAIDTAEDYDMLLLRLLSGEGGLVRMVSDDIQKLFAAEVQGTNPNLALLRECAGAELLLATEPLAYALGPGPEADFAPPDEEPPESRAPVELATRGTPADTSSKDDLEVPFDTVRFSLASPTPDSPVSGPVQAPRGADPVRGPRCGFCGGRLPANRTVNFCPHCGQNQSFTRCPECQGEIELGWRHCVNCGHPVAE